MLAAAREAADRALLARPGEVGLFELHGTRPEMTTSASRPFARSNGGLRWERSTERNGSPPDRDLRSVRHAVDAKDALRADKGVDG